jgi:hypothetical protein
MTVQRKTKRRSKGPTKTVYQFLYGTLPSAVAPVAIDSSAADADDPLIKQAESVSAWTPMGPIVLPETGPDGRIHPVPKLMWVRSLVVPASEMQVAAPVGNVPVVKESPLISVPPGTRVEDVIRGAR